VISNAIDDVGHVVGAEELARAAQAACWTILGWPRGRVVGRLRRLRRPAVASLLCAPHRRGTPDEERESVGAGLAAVAGESGTIPCELVVPGERGIAKGARFASPDDVSSANGYPVSGSVARAQDR
jgi:hypothetical protein